jgi:hypothetical protein
MQHAAFIMHSKLALIVGTCFSIGLLMQPGKRAG